MSQVPRSKGVLFSLFRDRHIDTNVNAEDTLSGFQEFFVQPIIKDRSNTSWDYRDQHKMTCF